MSARGLPIGRKDVQELAHATDKKHDSPLFDQEKGPSQGWLTGFLQRHPDIALRTPSHVDGGRFVMERE